MSCFRNPVASRRATTEAISRIIRQFRLSPAPSLRARGLRAREALEGIVRVGHLLPADVVLRPEICPLFWPAV